LIHDAIGNLDVEILVVDNGSIDDSVAMVQKQFPEVNLVLNKQNLGFPKAVNQGINESNGVYVILLNSDIMLTPGSLDQLVAYLNDNPEVAAAGPQLVDRSDHLQNSGGFAPSPKSAFRQMIGLQALFGGRSKGVYARSKSTKKAMPVDWLSGASMVLRRSAADEVGLLDDSHFMYAEDTEYGLRLRKQGWQLHLVPWVRVVHYGGASSAASSETKLLWLAGMFRVAAGNLSRPAYALFGLFMSLAFLERYLIIGATRILMKRKFKGVAREKELRDYARTSFKLSLKSPDYAKVLSQDLEKGYKQK